MTRTPTVNQLALFDVDGAITPEARPRPLTREEYEAQSERALAQIRAFVDAYDTPIRYGRGACRSCPNCTITGQLRRMHQAAGRARSRT